MPQQQQNQQNHHPMHVPVPTSNQYRAQQFNQAKVEQQRAGGVGVPMPQASTSQQQGQWNGGLRGGAAWVAGGEDGDVMRLRGGNGEEDDDDDSDDVSLTFSLPFPSSFPRSLPSLRHRFRSP